MLQFYHINTPTWARGQSTSQIDDIQLSTDIILDFELPIIIDPTGITDSDYMIIYTKWNTNFILLAKRSKKAKHKIYIYNKINKDKWEEFRENTQQMFLKKIDKVIITNEKELNRVQNKQKSIVKQAMNKCIPYTFTSPQQFFALLLKATKLHSVLKNINKTLRIL